MSDPRNSLQKKFLPQNRYSNFGPMLMQLHIQGFRCHQSTSIDIKSPITAFCGLNGTGKSTILQLAAVSVKNTNSCKYYLRDFFVVGTLDPAPYRPDAKVIYKFWQEDRSQRQLTLSRSTKSWSGYRRRSERSAFFAGVGVFLPKIEKRDFSIHQARILEIDREEEVFNQVKKSSSTVLGRQYEQMYSCHVSCGHKKAKVLVACRRGVTRYSEAHMGFGEGRAAYIVDALETLPDKSLVLIEEPETSLHPSAQNRLGKYFMDVSNRKGHQILLTTHSDYLLRCLPAASRIYLHDDNGTLRQITGLTASEATSLMTEGHDKALNLLVEDDCAKAIVAEMIRRSDSNFLQTVSLNSAGDHGAIRKAMSCLSGCGFQVAAVLDGDQLQSPKDNIFKLPGSQAPEKEMFLDKGVIGYLKSTYGFEWSDFYVANNLSQVDHHSWIDRLSIHLSMEKQSLTRELSRIYAEAQDCAAFTNLLREAISV